MVTGVKGFGIIVANSDHITTDTGVAASANTITGTNSSDITTDAVIGSNITIGNIKCVSKPIDNIPGSIAKFIDRVCGGEIVVSTYDKYIVVEGDKPVQKELNKKSMNITINVNKNEPVIVQLLYIKTIISRTTNELSASDNRCATYCKNDVFIPSICATVDLYVKYLSAVRVATPMLSDVIKIVTGIDINKLYTSSVTDIVANRIYDKYRIDIVQEKGLIIDIINLDNKCKEQLEVIISKMPILSDMKLESIYDNIGIEIRKTGNANKEYVGIIPETSFETVSLASPQYLAYLLIDNMISYNAKYTYELDLLLERIQSFMHSEHIDKLISVKNKIQTVLKSLEQKEVNIDYCAKDARII